MENQTLEWVMRLRVALHIAEFLLLVLFGRLLSPLYFQFFLDKIWDGKAPKNASLFNGYNFKFGGSILHTCNEEAKQQGSHAMIQLGLTYYRTFMGTYLSPLWEKFLVDSEGFCAPITYYRMMIIVLVSFFRLKYFRCLFSFRLEIVSRFPTLDSYTFE